MKTPISLLFAAAIFASNSFAQNDPGLGPRFDGPPPFGGPGGPGGPPGPQPKAKLLKKFDKNGDKFLTGEERKAALEFLQKERSEGRMRQGGPGGGLRRFGPPPGAEPEEASIKPGKKISPTDAKSYPEAGLYDPKVVRTVFIEFDTQDWHKEMAAFKGTDVEMPATVTIDGKVYKDVGVHYRGMSSFGMVPEGGKRSLDLTFDEKHKDQNVGGYREMELLNSHGDPTFLRTVLSYQIEREYLPAPKANFVRVVINGENWGIYINAQAFNKDFLRDNFGTTKGERWKAPGSPRGQASFKYLGDDAEAYKDIYELKSGNDAKAWDDLIRLCKILNETPAEKLEAELAPVLDVDGALKFLALENALINNDGYWVRTSDYSMYQDTKGVFHILPHDSNETFARPAGGPPGGRGPRLFRGPRPDGDQPPGDRPPGPPQGGGPGPGFQRMDIKGVELDPLMAAKDENKPLISKLLAVPKFREKYLGYVRDIAEKWLDWEKLGPLAENYQRLIAEEIREDTRKLSSTDAFAKGVTEDSGGGGFGPGGGAIGLKTFAEQRRAYLMKSTAK